MRETPDLAPASREEIEPLYVAAAEATATGSKSFYFATRFFPPHLARAAHAVYWFCRHTDDLVDEAPSMEVGAAALDEWEQALARAWDAGRREEPILRIFVETAHQFRIPREYPFELIEGMRMDLQGTHYADFASLREFCYRVASVVGLMMCHVIGFRDPAPAHAIDLGIAMQLTNILRDVGEDLRRGRVYLPAEDLEHFGYSVEDLRGAVIDDRFRALMQFQILRAEEYYQRAEPGIAMLHADGQFAVRVAADVYRGILREIEQNGYDVFGRRAVVPSSRKAWITARSMAVPMARHTMHRLAFWKSMNA
ncbi:MAG: phytoene/squalene synthase family protein [Bryobacterales bacterium]|nr:phytoene/squalene synthase family protein [Bryobacterales bacterium]